MTIITKQKIIETYESIYCLHKNDALRIAAVSTKLGVHTDIVVQVIFDITVNDA